MNEISTVKHLLESRLEPMLGVLRGYVDHDSPSADKVLLDSLALLIKGRLESAGGRARIVANPTGGNHVLARFGPEPTETGPKPALVLGHFDTVWPAGTAHRRRFRIEADRALGPGVFDMKASLVLVEFALAALAEANSPLPRAVDVLLTSDEEIGSPTSRGLIEELARAGAFALVVEPPLASGALKTARKGVGRFTINVTGKSAHAGVDPARGINAIVELSHQILRIQSFDHTNTGTTVSVGLVEGGSAATNVVPAAASAVFDVRVATLAEAERVRSAFHRLEPVLPGALVEVTGDFNRPPMERTDAIAHLFRQASRIALELGMVLAEGATGGGSDGNFTAAVGTPTLDGLGVPGGGAHAEDEHIEHSRLPERAALLAALLVRL